MPTFKSPAMARGFIIGHFLEIINIIDSVSKVICGRLAIITSVTGDDHGEASLHYAGYALDIRTNDLKPEVIKLYHSELKAALPLAYDVILEIDHIHIEYDPHKTGVPAA